METVGAFLPIDRRLALAAGRGLPDRAVGAVLFADIAGFTPLTEGLVRELGPQRGPEELTHHLNAVYAALVDAVHRFGGSVVGFGGDAITCWFPGDADGARAVTSAGALHAAMQPLATVETPAGTRFALGIKVAVAVGPVRRFVVGDPALRRLDVVAGRTLDAMADAEHAAERGETVVTAATAAALGDRLAVAQWRPAGDGLARVAVVGDLSPPAAPAPWPAVGEARGGMSPDAAREWLWPSVFARVAGEHGRFLAELRPAVALFLRFGGIDYDGDDQAGARLDAWVRAVERVIADREGTLLELSFGDKGSHLYAAFGAPAAFADDAARAVDAALALTALARDWPDVTEVRVGLARGPMRTGTYGSPVRGTYSVMGDRTNLAARLMAAAAPGEVLCDDAVADRARRHWEMESLAPVLVKGKAEAVAVFRPSGARTAAAPAVDAVRGDLVGRHAELAALEAAVADARAGRQRVVGIVGEGGIGKSRLTAELVARVRAAGLRCSVGAGQSIEQHTPYRAWRDVLTDGLDLGELGDAAERRRRVETRLAAGTPELLDRAPLLDDILGLGWDDNALTAGLDPAMRRDSLTDLVVGMLREWGRAQPCLVVLDDAQWLDDLSWDLAVAVARALAASRTPLFVALVMRPVDPGSPIHHRLAGLEALGLYAAVPLGGLDDGAIVALAAQRLGVAPGALPEPAAALVRERAEGNPFFAEELVLALRDRGVLRVVEVGAGVDVEAAASPPARSCVVVGDLDAARRELPSDVQGLVLARIDRLPPESQVVMKVASVIGRSFALTPLTHSLRRLAAMSEEAVTAGLEHLALRDLAVLEATRPDRVYAFNHIITQETAYGTLLFQQRRGMHRTVAGWYEDTYGAGADAPPPIDGAAALEPFYPLLVHHYERAEDVGRERVYGLLAGERAAAQYANADAVRFLSRALDIADAGDAAVRYRLLAAREGVHDRTGDRSAQAADIAAMAELAEGEGGAAYPRWRPEVMLRRANLALMIGDYADAAAIAGDGMELARSRGDRSLEIRGLIVLGKIDWQRGRFSESRDNYMVALDLSKAMRDTRSEAEALLNLSAVEAKQGRPVDSVMAGERSLELHRALGDRAGEAGCLISLAATHYEQGEYATILRYCEEASAICRLIGHRRGLSIIEGNLGALLYDMGDYAGAQARLRSALLTCRELGDRWGEATNLDTLGIVLHRLGDLAAARRHLDEALAIQRAIGDQHSAGYTLTHLGDLHADAGDWPAADAAHAEALAVRRGLGQDALGLDNLAGLAWVGWRRGAARDEAGVDGLGSAVDGADGVGDADVARARALVDETLAWIDAHGTDGIEFPVQVAWRCYRVLRASSARRPADGARAHDVLARARALVLERAEGIADPALRRSFETNVPFNRQVLEAWADGRGVSAAREQAVVDPGKHGAVHEPFDEPPHRPHDDAHP
ncbi:hypothetical protein DCC79_05250 [bacterium]|nr:MAG: hypothetical protein DCC79_05250 [bacterium]